MTAIKALLKPSLMCLILFSSLFGLQAQARTVEMTLVTSDKVKIHSVMSIPEAVKIIYPAVILIHQGGSDHSEWDFLIPALLKQSYVVLTYDVRGHGKSGKVAKINSLYNDPKQAPEDLAVALKFLTSKHFINKRRIAIIGSSIGANLANVGIDSMGIRTAVAISGKTSAALNLAGKKKLDMKSVFYISSNESEGARAKWAKELFDMTKEPRKLSIVEKSQAHGVGIFKDKATLQQDVLDWLKQTL